MKEILWSQKSIETWLKEGDRNTGFFHRMANAHRRRNCLNNISINDRKLVKEVDIKDDLVNAFQNLLLAPAGWSPPPPPPPPPDLVFNASMGSGLTKRPGWRKPSQRMKFG